MYLSLIIPVYNGDKYIKETFVELENFFDNKDFLEEIIFINDGSKDQTLDILKYKAKNTTLPNVYVINLDKNHGKGFALKEGLKNISNKSNFVGFTDIELPYGLEPFVEGIDKMKEDSDLDIIVGNRTTKNHGQGQYSFYRKMFTNCFRLFLPQKIRKISDTQSGFKIFRLNTAKIIFSKIKTNRWVFDVEIFLIAINNKFKIYEFPVQIKPLCRSGKGGVSFFRHGRQIIKDLLNIYHYDKKGYYKN